MANKPWGCTRCTHLIFYCLFWVNINRSCTSNSSLSVLPAAWLSTRIPAVWLGWVTAGSEGTVLTQMSHGGNTVPSRMSHGGNMPGTSASAASKPGPPSSRWVSMLGPPTCEEPDAGSSTVLPRSGTCPAPIWPPVRHKLCPYIAQVRREVYNR